MGASVINSDRELTVIRDESLKAVRLIVKWLLH